MRSTAVQEGLCTEPKETPEDNLRFTVGFEESVLQQKSFRAKQAFKKEPVFTITINIQPKKYTLEYLLTNLKPSLI